MAELGRLPRTGDGVEAGGLRLKVTEMDGRRAARVRVTVLVSDEDESLPLDPAATSRVTAT